jgi:hypothetical protein
MLPDEKMAPPLPESSKSGFVYFLLNGSMPGLLKIGFTQRSVVERMAELNTTGVPTSFVVGALFNVLNPHQCENDLHRLLVKYRVAKNREFFQISLAHAIDLSAKVISEYALATSRDKDIVNIKRNQICQPDKDDIYFMQFILHDGYSEKRPISTRELSQHHTQYHPLELEVKLNNLHKANLLVRVATMTNDGLSSWKISNFGLEFMVRNNHTLQDLIEEEKRMQM